MSNVKQYEAGGMIGLSVDTSTPPVEDIREKLLADARERRRQGQLRYRDKTKFGGNREIAIQRDGEKCVQCGMTRQEHFAKYGKDITVDHIDKMGLRAPRELKNNSLDNLQTLCPNCHARKTLKELK